MQRQVSSQISALSLVGISILGGSLTNNALAQTRFRESSNPVQGAPAEEIQFENETTRFNQLNEFSLLGSAHVMSQARLTSQPKLELELPGSDRQPPAASPIKQLAQDEKQGPSEEDIDTAKNAGVVDAEITAEDSDRSKSPLAPVQTRQLSNKITAVTTSEDGIGTGQVPETDRASTSGLVGLPTGFERGAPFTCVHWQASLVCHRPLYFEDAMLERHGHRRYGCLQPLASGAKFFTTIPLLPYLQTLRAPRSCVYDLGYYRPGSCAPLLHDTLPYDKHAAVAETLATAGFFWATPM